MLVAPRMLTNISHPDTFFFFYGVNHAFSARLERKLLSRRRLPTEELEQVMSGSGI
jgi:hypothetical protein